jgi:hypothetical protein
MTEILHRDRVARAKRAFSTRTVPEASICAVTFDVAGPRAGDLVLARVDAVGAHKQLELTTSRKATLFPGDEVILAYGNRYAPDQFEAEVPATLGPCHLAAAGGIASFVLGRNAAMAAPTAITPVGLIVDEMGRLVNLRRFGRKAHRPASRVPCIAVVGGSMNAGKTTAAASIVKGLASSGLKVGAAKITGTGAGNDYWHMWDAGAHMILDFTDAGFATTYKAAHADLEEIANTLAAELVAAGCDAIVFEIADGLYQAETSWLVGSRALESLVDAYVYAAESSASAAMGVEWLRGRNRLVLGISGLVSRSPLACRESEAATKVTCYTKEALASPEVCRRWADILAGRAAARAA